MSVIARTVCWFSCGASSAVATKLILSEGNGAEVFRIRITSEHPDSDRFAKDCQEWFGKTITTISPEPYDSHLDVIEFDNPGYINGPSGAKCTRVLKRKVRERLQLPGDIHVFGFDWDERDRAEDFRERNPDLLFRCPLIESMLTKSDCHRILERQKIEKHAMYKMGYDNANCVGCVKGGMGYWNKIRVDFPDRFFEMARIERKVGATVLKKGGERLYLDQLDPSAGRFKEDQPGECGILCQIALEKVGL